tara:strand:- start:70 stop:552 length:483 start_codon:yes stop_codon:yes gene_type:complete
MKNLTEAEKNWKNINKTYLYAFCYGSYERVRFPIKYFWENVVASKEIRWTYDDEQRGIGCRLIIFLTESERDEFAKEVYDDYDNGLKEYDPDHEVSDRDLPFYSQTHCIDANRHGLRSGMGHSPRIKVNDVLIEYKTLIAVQGYSSLAKDKDNQHEPTED